MMTKKEALEKTRNMWWWIAEECEKQKRVINKKKYFEYHNISNDDIPHNKCYLCEYQKQHDVTFCLLEKWNLEENYCGNCCCEFEFGDYYNSCDDDDYKKCAKAANAIANLAEMELERL